MSVITKKKNQYRTDIIVPLRDGTEKIIVAKISKTVLANLEKEDAIRQRKDDLSFGKGVFWAIGEAAKIQCIWNTNRKRQDEKAAIRREKKAKIQAENAWLLRTTPKRVRAKQAAIKAIAHINKPF